MLDAVLCQCCGHRIHRRRAMIKWVTNTLAIDFECRKCKGCHKNGEDQEEIVHEDVETVTDF